MKHQLLVLMILYSSFTLPAAHATEEKKVPRYLYCVGFLNQHTRATNRSDGDPSTVVVLNVVRGPDTTKLTEDEYISIYCTPFAATEDAIQNLLKKFHGNTVHISPAKPCALFKIDTSKVRGEFLFKSGLYYFGDYLYLDAVVEVKEIESPESTL